MKGLAEVGVVGSFALARALPLRPAENVEEVRADLLVGKIDGAHLLGKLKLVRVSVTTSMASRRTSADRRRG